MQGRLTDTLTTATIETACGHCGQQMRLTVNSEMQYDAELAGSNPMFFEPQIDWLRFREPNIIHAY